jgi:hypothetical protein
LAAALAAPALVWAFLGLAAAAADAPGWKAGVARAKITPEKPMWMAGYGSRVHPSEGTCHDLWVKALALEAADGGRAIVVTSDILEFPKVLGDHIAQAIASECGVARDHVMLTSSHTHCGPALVGSLGTVYPLDDAGRALIVEYSAWLEKVVPRTAREALGRLAPATLEAGEGEAGFAANRRNNREREVAKLLAAGKPLKGPVDHTVPVLAVRGGDGVLLAVVASYACHNTTLNAYQWCGDYAGFMQAGLEARHPGLTAMFYEGCAGDQNPLPRLKLELCQRYGKDLADAVDAVLARPMRPVGGRLRTAFETIELPFNATLDVPELTKMAKGKDYRARWAAGLLARQKAGKPGPRPYPYPIQAWRLGGQLWIALGGEVVVDYALRFKKQYGPTTWVNGYSNDVMGYIPSHRVWQEKGYEAGAFPVYDLPADRWCEDIEERIAAGVERVVERVR